MDTSSKLDCLARRYAFNHFPFEQVQWPTAPIVEWAIVEFKRGWLVASAEDRDQEIVRGKDGLWTIR